MSIQLDASRRSETAPTASAASLSSRQSFLEHVNHILRTPLPECLQPISLPRSNSQHPQAALQPSDSNYLLGLLQPSAATKLRHPRSTAHHLEHNHHRDSTTSSTAAGGITTAEAALSPLRASAPPDERPFYERLLEEGRRAAERREQLAARAAAAETAELRPAPSLPSHYQRKPLPPQGQRIEDRLLQRARERDELLEQQRHEAQQRREEELKKTAPFRPCISARAQGIQPKYTRTPEDFEAWRARRKHELETARQARLAAEAAEHKDAPDINPHSAKLAAQRRRREELQALDPVLSTSANATRLQQPSTLGTAAQAAARPTISDYAARLERQGRVSDRLYADASALEQRRKAREQERRDALPFRPVLTARGASSMPRYDGRHDASGDEAGRSGGRSSARDVDSTFSPIRRSRSCDPSFAFTPVINPVSDAIARRLSASSRDRLQRQPRSRAMSADLVQRQQDGTKSRMSSKHRDSDDTRGPSDVLQDERGSTDDDGDEGKAGSGVRLVAPLPPHVADAFAFYERRRRERLRSLQLEQEARLREHCTFVPRTNDDDMLAHGVRAESSHDGSYQHPCRSGYRSNTDEGNQAGVVERSHQWLETRERRLEKLRWQRRQDEDAEIRRCARWREESGLFADRPRPSEPLDRASPRDYTWRDEALGSAPLMRGTRADGDANKVVTPPQHHGPQTVGSIYESVYHVDPTRVLPLHR